MILLAMCKSPFNYSALPRFCDTQKLAPSRARKSPPCYPCSEVLYLRQNILLLTSCAEIKNTTFFISSESVRQMFQNFVIVKRKNITIIYEEFNIYSFKISRRCRRKENRVSKRLL